MARAGGQVNSATSQWFINLGNNASLDNVEQKGANVPTDDPGRLAGIPKVQGDLFNRAGLFSDSPSRTHLDALASETPSPAE